MDRQRQKLTHATSTSHLADMLERVLDKGIVIAGDIKVTLVDVELLTIQVRLMILSVDKARELGMDWWLRNPEFASGAVRDAELGELRRQMTEIGELRRQIAQLGAAVQCAK